MQYISQKAGLSDIYTCHSVRASTITTLFQAGIPAQNIIAVSNHKDVSSLKHYIQDMSNEQKRSCSGVLQNALHHDGQNKVYNLCYTFHITTIQVLTV